MPGDLSETTPIALCLRLAGERATGTLALAGPDGEAVLVFADGRLSGGRPPGHGAPLGERLVAAGRLARPDLDTALADQTSEPGPAALGRILVERGLASEDEVRLFVQEQAIEALLTVSGWLEGSWDFSPAAGVAPTGAGPGLPVDQVVEEVRRRAAERARVAEVVPSPTSVFAIAGDGAAGRLDEDAARVLEVVDGQRTVRDVADALAIDVDEASRRLYRLVLQGRAVPADTMGTSPAQATSAPADPATEEAALHAPTTTGSPPVQLADDGWAAAREHARTVADEPEPWVGWANGGTPAADTTPPGADDATSSLWGHAPPPATSGNGAPTSTTAGMDGDTRRQLFSELHEVGRAHPGLGAAQAPAPAPAPEQPAASTSSEPTEPHEVDPAASTPEAPAAPLSRSDVSDLLRELHALNLDD